MILRKWMWIGLVLWAMLGPALGQTPWAGHVSAPEKARVNPYASQPDAIAAGARLFAEHCSQCHGRDALGRKKWPSLRTPEVQRAPDGELFWLLRNGALRQGMPSWSSLPEASRWQLIAYVKSLGESSTIR